MRAFLFVLALLAAAAGDAVAAERITSFTSDVTIGADSALTVKETLRTALPKDTSRNSSRGDPIFASSLGKS